MEFAPIDRTPALLSAVNWRRGASAAVREIARATSSSPTLSRPSKILREAELVLSAANHAVEFPTSMVDPIKERR